MPNQSSDINIHANAVKALNTSVDYDDKEYHNVDESANNTSFQDIPRIASSEEKTASIQKPPPLQIRPPETELERLSLSQLSTTSLSNINQSPAQSPTFEKNRSHSREDIIIRSRSQSATRRQLYEYNLTHENSGRFSTYSPEYYLQDPNSVENIVHEQNARSMYTIESSYMTGEGRLGSSKPPSNSLRKEWIQSRSPSYGKSIGSNNSDHIPIPERSQSGNYRDSYESLMEVSHEDNNSQRNPENGYISSNVSDIDDQQSPFNEKYQGYGEEEEDDEARAEELYNRMRMLSRGKQSAMELKPVGKSLQMGKVKHLQHSGSQSSLNSFDQLKRNLVGKSTHERLYQTATLNRKKQEMVEQRKDALLKKQLQDDQFRLNENSRKITENLFRGGHGGSNNGDGDSRVNERLYQEGMKELEQKKKQEEIKEKKKQAEVTYETWSCIRCGNFHRVNTSTAINMYNNKKTMKCQSCGWEQEELHPNKPSNIGLMLLQEEGIDLLKARNESIRMYKASHEESFANRNQSAYGPVSTIHEYLHHTGCQQEQILHFNRELWHELHAQMTFKPQIPDSSKQILQKYKQRQAGNGSSGEDDNSATGNDGDNKSTVSSISGVEDRSQQSDMSKQRASQKLSGEQLKEYINQPTLDRLTKTNTKALDNHITERRRMEDLQQKKPFIKKPTANKEEFVNRLVYEYKEKDSRWKQEQINTMKVDEKTGRPFFHPKVDPIPDGIVYTGNHVNARFQGQGPKDIWSDILRRDTELQSKKLSLQRKAVEKTLSELNKRQVKALPSSNEILQKATLKNLEDLFKLLLASVMPPDEEDEYDEEVEEEEDYESEAAIERHIAKLHQKAQVISDWKKRSLDMLEVDPHFMINEVSTLLIDMKTILFLQWQEKNQAEHANDIIEDGEVATYAPDNLIVDFPQFAKLAIRCSKQREGPGKGYVFVTKKKPEVALAMKRKEEEEQTFKPEIDKTSMEILSRNNRQIRLLSLPIETILHADGDRVKAKVERQRQEKILKEAEELTFKPHLYKPPSYVVPKYRGLDIQQEEQDVDEESCQLNDNNSVQNFVTSAANRATFAVPFGESQGSKALNAMLHQSNSSSYIRGASTVSVQSGSQQYPSPLMSPMATRSAAYFSIGSAPQNPSKTPATPIPFISPSTVYSVDDHATEKGNESQDDEMKLFHRIQLAHSHHDLDHSHQDTVDESVERHNLDLTELEDEDDEWNPVVLKNETQSKHSGTSYGAPAVSSKGNPNEEMQAPTTIKPTYAQIPQKVQNGKPAGRSRSSSPDMSTFSDGTISTKFTVDDVPMSKASSKSHNSYSSKHRPKSASNSVAAGSVQSNKERKPLVKMASTDTNTKSTTSIVSGISKTSSSQQSSRNPAYGNKPIKALPMLPHELERMKRVESGKLIGYEFFDENI